MNGPTITLTCPHGEESGDPCEAAVDVELGYEPDDPKYGADADGHRGVFVRGGWYVESVADRCEKGHTFSAAETQALGDRADRAARDYRPEPDLPDFDDDDRYVGRYARRYGY